jgi:Uma2 family endonuclease
MSSAASKNKTAYEKWMELSDDVVGEIIAGELHVSPRPAPKHSRASTKLSGVLDGPFDSGKGGPGGWTLLFEPEIHINSNIFVPDIGGWRRERLSKAPEEPFISIAPDWICEVLSPSTTTFDRSKKMPLYAELGLSHFWLVDPIHKTLEIYVNDHMNWKLLKTYANDDKVRAAPFDALEFDLSILWF